MSHFKRRDFIKNSVLAGVGASLLSEPLQVKGQEAFKSSKKSNKAAKKVSVGGGGIGGLCTAYELMKKGHDVTN